MKFTKYKNNRGFTLIEILIAMGIISLIAMAFSTILNSTIKANSVNEKNIKCLNIAQSEVENIRQQIKESKSIQVESSESYEPIPIEIGVEKKVSKDIKNDNNMYYEKIKVDKETISVVNGSQKVSNYLYTINVFVHYNEDDFDKGKGKEITTQVFSKK
jgi:prepilin-type N-terminal cleavage/methylation domain-containing protein